MPKPPRVPSAEWTDPRHRLGLEGEHSAIAFLTAGGWTIEAHRFRVGRHELDLVARRGSLVAFVEVKTRRGDGYGAGREAIGWRKRQALGRVADVWRLRHGRAGDVYRFDVVEVLGKAGPRGSTRLVHVADAWRL
jgi:putative endonuclease